MKTRFFVAVLSACMAVGLFAPYSANADGTSVYGHALEHNPDACNNWARISHSDVDCMHAWWDNSPPVSAGVGAGSTYGVESYCSEWGTVVANIDIKNAEDRHVHMYNIGRWTAKVSHHDIRNISCCIDDSDLCYKNQVRPKDGQDQIAHITVSGSSWTSTSVKVDTHWKRYDFCQQNPSYIYCTANVSGDVWNKPDTPRCAEDNSCSCGDHVCSAESCDAEWDMRHGNNNLMSRSGCAASDHDRYSSTYDDTTQTCTVTTACGTGRYSGRIVNGVWQPGSTTTVNVIQFSDDLENFSSGLHPCGGEMRVTNCHGESVSTFLESYTITVE